MTPFTTVTGAAIPFLRDNVDTDVIIRIERLTSHGKADLGPFAFEALRFAADGSVDPDCPFNLAKFRDAPVLLAGRNFGCGSSREAAVWALQGLGVRCAIAESFGDIFFSNCFQNGVLPLRLPHEEVAALARQCESGKALTVDLTTSTLTAPDGTVRQIEVEPLRRRALLAGLDDIGLTLQEDNLIRAWQARDRQARPWVWLAGPTRPSRTL